MNKFLLTFFILVFNSLYSLEIISYGVDGVNNNKNVVIKNRNPIVFFEYTDAETLTKYELKISTFYNGLFSGTTIWFVSQTSSPFNEINNIVRIEIPSMIGLKVKSTYYIMLDIYGNLGSSKTVTDTFFTSPSVVEFNSNVSLEVDYKNPFAPRLGEITKIRYVIKDKDISVRLCIFDIFGKYINTLTDSVAIKDVVYSVDWDGKDKEGNVLPAGIYIVSLILPSQPSVVKLVGIVDQK
ncbi:MAG: hypothetical protein N2643_00925 [Endomicrobia bacterium]|nr:hypothetical protein [Endomicrobiia bacterium]